MQIQPGSINVPVCTDLGVVDDDIVESAETLTVEIGTSVFFIAMTTSMASVTVTDNDCKMPYFSMYACTV